MVKPALSDSKTCLLSPILGVGKLWATGQFWPTSLKCFLHFKWLNTTKRRIFHEGWKLYKIQVSTSIKAVLLEHSHDHSLVVCDYFCTLRAGLSNCTWDLVACQAWNINSVQKNFSTPALYHAASEHRIVWKKNKCTCIDWMGYFLILSILVSQGCHNKVPLTGWLNRNVFFLQFWKPEAWNQGVGKVGSFWEFWGRICSRPFSWLLLTANNPWHSLAYRCLTPTLLHMEFFLCLCIFMWPSPYKDKSHIGLGAHSIPVWTLLN